MRSTDNFARENVIVKATAKLEHQGVQPNRQAVLEEVQKDPELSAALEAINKRESECSTSLEKAFRDRIAIPLPGACASSKEGGAVPCPSPWVNRFIGILWETIPEPWWQIRHRHKKTSHDGVRLQSLSQL